MSNTTITINNLRISSLFTRHIITNGDYDNNHSIFVSEYDIEEILDVVKEGDDYSPKKVYYVLLDHIFEIIRRQSYCRRTIFCFSLYQNLDNNNDFQTMRKDIEVYVNDYDTPSEEVFYNIESSIDRMDNNDQIDLQDLRLIFIKTELLTPTIHTRYINNDRTFKTHKCLVCFNSKSTVLYCNCGHIVCCVVKTAG